MIDVSSREIQSAISRLQNCDDRTAMRLTGYLMVAATRLRQRVAEYRRAKLTVPPAERRDIDLCVSETAKQHKRGINIAEGHRLFMSTARF